MDEIYNEAMKDKNIVSLIENFLVKLSTKICIMPDIPEKYKNIIFKVNKTHNLDKQDSTMKNSSRHGADSETRSGLIIHERRKSNVNLPKLISSHTLIINLMNNGYQSPDDVEGVHNKAEAYQTEHDLILYLKTEMYFLISRWLKL